jgi:hypothetical protein
MKKIIFKITLFLTSYLLCVSIAGAQLNVGQFNLGGVISLSNELSVDLVPTYPAPNSMVFVSLRMYTEDLNRALIVWTLNGKQLEQGRGLTSFSFMTGPVGSPSRLMIDITLQSGVTFSREVNIRPASVDLLWQSDSFVPPFYRGKALFPKQGNIFISAIPNFNSGASQVDPSKLIYKWTVNNKVQEFNSGYGKSVISVSGPILGTPINAEVQIIDPSNNMTAENSIRIQPVEPIVLFYENSPLYGIIFEKAINSGIGLNGEEVNIVAFPMFMNTQDDIAFSWRMNGKSAPEVAGLSATFRKPEGRGGSTLLSLSAENHSRILQYTEGGLNINYDNE